MPGKKCTLNITTLNVKISPPPPSLNYVPNPKQWIGLYAPHCGHFPDYETFRGVTQLSALNRVHRFTFPRTTPLTKLGDNVV